MPQTPSPLNFEGIPDQAAQPSVPAQPSTFDFGGIPDQTGGNAQPRGPVPPSVPRPSVLSVAQKLTAPFDVTTSEGRQNVAGAAGAVAVGAMTEGMGALPWITRILATPSGAALGGMVAEGGEQAVGTKPASSTAIGVAGLTQGAYEYGGKVLLWPFQRGLTMLKAAPTVARQAEQWVADNVTGAKHAAADLVTDATTRGRNYVKRIQGPPGGQGGGTRQAVADAVAAATKQRADDKFALEVWQGEQVQAARKVYDAIGAPVEAMQGAREGARAVTRTTVPRGAAQVGLDVAGRKVEAAAETGPALALAPVQTAIEQMLVESHPGTIFQPQETSTGIGFIDQLRARRQGEAAAGVATSADQIKLTERIAQAMGVSPETLSAPGLGERVKELTNILGRIMTTKEQVIPFRDAHRLKLLLDESVNWDQTAKKAMERITKGTRQALREQMTTHAPYDQATAEYAKQVQLYRRGAGKALITAARDNPDKVLSLLKPDQPAAAQQIKDLLVDQSAKGGDPVVGYQAWQDLQSAFVYDKIVKGGPEGLSQRIGKLLTESPEFSKIVLGDPTAARVLSNLDRIGQAYTQSVEATAIHARVADEQSRRGTQLGVTTARQAATDRLTTAKQAASDEVARVRGAGAQDVAIAQATKKGFEKSSVAKFAKPRSAEDLVVNLGVATVRPGSIYGIRSIARLLESGPQRDELLQWAAHSDQNTQRLVKALNSQLPPTAVAALLREMIGYANANQTAQGADTPTSTRETRR